MTTKQSKKHHKSHKSKKSSKKLNKKHSIKHNKKNNGKLYGGMFYEFDNNDLIGGLPAVKPKSNCKSDDHLYDY